MTLEAELQQSKPFKSPYHKASVNLMYTYGWFTREMKTHFTQYEVTPKQFNIMRILNGANKPVSTSYIKTRLLDRVSDVSRIVDRMEQKELIIKKASDADKRLVDIALSTKGLKLLAQINDNMHFVEKLFKNLNKKEINVFNDLLDKIRN